MNDEFRKALDTRLSGLRWGEREQAKVLRAIHTKEVTEVKHVKRGTMALAFAIATLFLVMGAAFALTGLPQPNDTTPATPLSTDFLPTPIAQVENDYLTMTVRDAAWDGTTAVFEAVLTLKEPEKYLMHIGGHTSPGDPERTLLSVIPGASFSAAATANSLGQSHGVDVIDMTTASATIRITGSTGESDAETLAVQFSVSVNSNTHSVPSLENTLTFYIIRETQAIPADVLFDDGLISISLSSGSYDGERVELVLDVAPGKPWYILNRSDPSKATLNFEMFSVGPRTFVDGQALVMSFPDSDITSTVTESGVRITVSSALTDYAADTLTLCATYTTTDAATGAVQTGMLTFGLPNTGEVKLPEPTGKVLLESDYLTMYLEDCWYDGFSAEATLRLRRPEGAAHKLAIAPNESAQPSDSTWVVSMGTGYEYFQNYTSFPVEYDPVTGDVLVQFSYEELHATNDDNQSFSLPIVLTLTNELTWETTTFERTLEIPLTDSQTLLPLYLIDNDDGVDYFRQGSLLITDHAAYVGLLFQSRTNGWPMVSLVTETGELLGFGNCYGTSGESLIIFPRTLFPVSDDIDRDGRFYEAIMRLDKMEQPPETLTFQLDHRYMEQYEQLAVLACSVGKKPDEPVEKQVSIMLDANVLFDNELVTIYFKDADYMDGHAAAFLFAELKDPERLTLVKDDPDRSKEYLEIDLKMTAQYPAMHAIGDFRILTDHDDSASADITMYGFFEPWLNQTELPVQARLTLRSASGAFDQTYLASYSFPQRGSFDIYTLTPSQPISSPCFEFISGTLVETDYLSRMLVQYRCTAPYETASISVSQRGEPLPLRLHDENLRSPDEPDARVRCSEIVLWPDMLHTDEPFELNVSDSNSPDQFGNFEFTLTK